MRVEKAEVGKTYLMTVKGTDWIATCRGIDHTHYSGSALFHGHCRRESVGFNTWTKSHFWEETNGTFVVFFDEPLHENLIHLEVRKDKALGLLPIPKGWLPVGET
jgi:hypothetical protein